MKHGKNLCLALLLLGCGGVAAGSVDSAEPQNFDQLNDQVQKQLDPLKKELKAYHAESYQSAIGKKLTEAGEWIRKRAPEVKKAAIVLDIDETSLSNWEELVANDFAFIASGPCSVPAQFPCGATGFDQSTRATAIAPTLKLYKEARKLGIAIFFVTGRFDDPLEKSGTELNLWKAGYDEGWAGIIMRHDHDGSPSVAPYKTGARKQIEADGYTIIANIGDQQSDLDGGHAERTFKVPNPFYFIP